MANRYCSYLHIRRDKRVPGLFPADGRRRWPHSDRKVLCRTNMPPILKNHVSSIQSISICNFPKCFCSEHPQAKPTELYTNLESLTYERVVDSASCACKILFCAFFTHSVWHKTFPKRDNTLTGVLSNMLCSFDIRPFKTCYYIPVVIKRKGQHSSGVFFIVKNGVPLPELPVPPTTTVFQIATSIGLMDLLLL